ncbi:hypothetical protein F5144DRAFT_601091 [Chaetomium tenue]|uniref:Uncharacterized protein n=1 Tax=Chaetomium tenue TaxID=1854479 RepID=A0ACB7PDF8_9PEZI|nr:hypothetical protein F5144DRAFT_601091 [Chaetomium globosum]
MVKPKKKKQQTLEATLGRPPVRQTIRSPWTKKGKAVQRSPVVSSPVRNAAPLSSSPPAPPSSFMRSSQVPGSSRKARAVLKDSSSEETSEDEQEQVLPVRETRRVRRSRLFESGSESESESSNGSSEKGKETREETDDQEEDDDKPLATPITRRRRHLVVSESDEDEQSPVPQSIKRRRLVRRNVASSPTMEKTGAEDEEEPPTPPSAKASRVRRKPLTQKQKARELLRRKRAGEVINEDDDSLFSDEESEKPMYDTDSGLVALEEFEDDEEGVNEPRSVAAERKKSKKKRKRVAVEDDDDDDDDDDNESGSMDDFVVEDGDAPLGAPDEDHDDIPLEYTGYAQAPLKVYFRVAIEWLVKFKVNPGFPEREADVYRMAWRKLDDEVRGLANSKFSSAAWKRDFYMALRARPHFDSADFFRGGMLEGQNCGACGRSGHPAKHSMKFTGDPYYKNTIRLDRFLQPVEMDSEPDSGSESHDDDEDGNHIPKAEKEWYVGAVCNSNAETAHDLIHWKMGLLVFVDTRLHIEGHMAANKVAERENMEAEQKDELVDKIMSHWEKNGMVKALYSEFKGTIERARNKPTNGRYR